MIKIVIGIKRFIEEKFYGVWFNDLFLIVKICDVCRFELVIELLSLGVSVLDLEIGDILSFFVVGIKEKIEILKFLKKRKDDFVVEVIGLIKNVIENDLMKDMIFYLREEVEKVCEYEFKIL